MPQPPKTTVRAPAGAPLGAPLGAPSALDATVAVPPQGAPGLDATLAHPATPPPPSSGATRAGGGAGGGAGGASERYQTLATLGEGGVGAVYRSHDAWLQRSVALKRLKVGAGDPAARSAAQSYQVGLFVREARVLAQLNHPGIVPIYDISLEGEPFFTMEELAGVTLDVLINELRDATPQRSFQLFDALLRHLLSVCEAVSYAHGKGVLHRDLKPSNIIITHHGAARVIDWGLGRLGEAELEEEARAPADLPEALLGLNATLTGSLSGTPLYMSPEQARAERLDERSDVFSLGVILYELIAGRSPHERAGGFPGTMELVSSLQRGEPLPPLSPADSQHPHLYSPALAEACARALAPRREERLASVAELAAALSAHLSGEARRAESAEHLEAARALYEEWRGALDALSAPQEAWARALTAPADGVEETRRERLLGALERAYLRDPSLWQVPLWCLEVRAQALAARWERAPSARLAADASEACRPDLARLLSHRGALERELLEERPWAAPLVADILSCLERLAAGARPAALRARGAPSEAGARLSLSLTPLRRVDTPEDLARLEGLEGGDGGEGSEEPLAALAGALDPHAPPLALSLELPVGFYLARLCAHGIETLHPLEVPPLTPRLLRAARLEPLAARLDALGPEGVGEARERLRAEVALELVVSPPPAAARAARGALPYPRWLPQGRCRVGTHLPITEALVCERVEVGGCWVNDSPVTLEELGAFFTELRRLRLELSAEGEETPEARDVDERLLLPRVTYSFSGFEGSVPFELKGEGAEARYRVSEPWRAVGYTEDSPASWHSYLVALSYATWRSWRDELLVELPHELEWEAAARGPDRRVFAWGDLCHERLSLNRLTTDGEQIRCPRPRERARSSFPLDASPIGLIGLSGNLSDWCWISTSERDAHRARLSRMIEERRRLAASGAAPRDLLRAFARSEAWRYTLQRSIEEMPNGAARFERIFKVARGGSLVNPLERCALSYRFRSLVQKGYHDVGFRLCARPLPSQAPAAEEGP